MDVLNPVPGAPSSAEALFFDGTQRLQQGDLAGAEAALRAALQLSPTLAEAHANLGLVLELRHAWPEAADCYRQSIAHNSTLVDSYVNLAGVLILMHQLDEAEAACAIALRLRRDDPHIWCNLGVVYARMGLENPKNAAAKPCCWNPATPRPDSTWPICCCAKGAGRKAGRISSRATGTPPWPA